MIIFLYVAIVQALTKQHNWFINLFSWLERCENEFGFENLKGYDTGRLYAYLAERYASFWFKKYTKSLEWPVVYCDINK